MFAPRIFSYAESGISWLGPKYGLTAALHDDVDLAKRFFGLIDQMLQLLFFVDVARHRYCFAAFLNDARNHFCADVGLAAGDDHLGAVFGHTLCDGASYATDEPVIRATLPDRSNSSLMLFSKTGDVSDGSPGCDARRTSVSL